MWHIIKDILGQKFGKLTVIAYAGTNKDKKAIWNCECECGNTAIITGDHLRSGNSKSCGCLTVTHGLSQTQAAKWLWDMHQRCYNPNNKGYKNYGGRGIYVNEEWNTRNKPNNGLVNFYKWTEENPKPGPEYSLDRIDNDGPYSPTNCRWATSKEQNTNRRTVQDLEIYKQFIKFLNQEEEFKLFCQGLTN